MPTIHVFKYFLFIQKYFIKSIKYITITFTLFFFKNSIFNNNIFMISFINKLLYKKVTETLIEIYIGIKYL